MGVGHIWRANRGRHQRPRERNADRRVRRIRLRRGRYQPAQEISASRPRQRGDPTTTTSPGLQARAMAAGNRNGPGMRPTAGMPSSAAGQFLNCVPTGPANSNSP
jgi:hypothetical protein